MSQDIEKILTFADSYASIDGQILAELKKRNPNDQQQAVVSYLEDVNLAVFQLQEKVASYDKRLTEKNKIFFRDISKEIPDKEIQSDINTWRENWRQGYQTQNVPVYEQLYYKNIVGKSKDLQGAIVLAYQGQRWYHNIFSSTKPEVQLKALYAYTNRVANVFDESRSLLGKLWRGFIRFFRRAIDNFIQDLQTIQNIYLPILKSRQAVQNDFTNVCTLKARLEEMQRKSEQKTRQERTPSKDEKSQLKNELKLANFQAQTQQRITKLLQKDVQALEQQLKICFEKKANSIDQLQTPSRPKHRKNLSTGATMFQAFLQQTENEITENALKSPYTPRYLQISSLQKNGESIAVTADDILREWKTINLQFATAQNISGRENDLIWVLQFSPKLILYNMTLMNRAEKIKRFRRLLGACEEWEKTGLFKNNNQLKQAFAQAKKKLRQHDNPSPLDTSIESLHNSFHDLPNKQASGSSMKP